MISFPPLSALSRPDAPGASAETRTRLQFHRLLTLLGALLLLALHPVSLLPGPSLPLWARLGTAGLLIGLWGASYGSGWVRRHYVTTLRGLFYLSMGSVATTAALHHFADAHGTFLLLTYALLLLAVWAGAQSMGPVFRFGGFGLLAPLVTAGMTAVPLGRTLVALAGLGTVAAVEGTLILASRRNRSRAEKRAERLRTITENVSDGIYRSVPGRGIVYANRAFAEMFGYECVEDVLELDPARLYRHPDERARRRQALDTHDSFDAQEVEFQRQDGTSFTGLLSGTVVRDPDGAVRCYDGAITDITAQKEAEQDLRAERDRFETLFESLPTPVARCTVEDGRALVADVNPAFEAVFGLEAAAARGRALASLFESPSGDDAPEHNGPDAPDAQVTRAEVRRDTTDGRHDFRLQVASRTRADGTAEVYAIYTDITEQKEAERTLRNEQAALRRMYRITADRDASFESKVRRLLDLGCEYLDLPYGFLTRISDGEQTVVHATGSHALLQRGARCPLSEAYCRKTLTQERPLAVQNAPAEDWADDPAYNRFGLGSYIGAQVWVGTERYGTFCFADDAARAEPFSDREKTFVELLTLWARYDLEQRRDKTRLERQNSRLDRFASVLSHDLRNPLNTAMMTLDLAREADDPRRPLEDVGNALDRMRGIIQDVLALTRDGDIPSDARTPVPLSSVIEASWSHVDTVRATLRNEAGGMVRADETRLRRLLENLFRNAVEHGGSEVVVRTGLVSNGFFVADDGPGIPEEKRKAVFDDGYSSRRDGTGLGLSIVETVAKAHGWSLSVTDSRTGGARFEIADMDLSQTAAAPSG